MRTASFLLVIIPVALCAFVAVFVPVDPPIRIAAATIAFIFVAAALAVWFRAPAGYLTACWGLWIGVLGMAFAVLSGEPTDGRGEWIVPVAMSSLALVGLVGVIVTIAAQRR